MDAKVDNADSDIIQICILNRCDTHHARLVGNVQIISTRQLWLGGMPDLNDREKKGTQNIGTMSCYLASTRAGVAVAYIFGKNSPSMATARGLFIWKEFKLAEGIKKVSYCSFFILYNSFKTTCKSRLVTIQWDNSNNVNAF